MSSALRKEFYEFFAQAANSAGIAWVVLSGIEGYPSGIGRDLDVACKGAREARRLSVLFVDCLHRKGFRWVVYPSPIWGRRILGITGDYAAVELHIVDPVRIGSISLEPSWSALDFEGGLFPTDPLLRFFKRCLMPALTGNEAWRRKCAETRIPRQLPWWLRSTAEKLRAGQALTRFESIRLSARYFIATPIAALRNLAHWRIRRGIRRGYPAAPVYALEGVIRREDFITLAERTLLEVFTGVVCVDALKLKQIRSLQAIQRLTFVTKPRRDIDDVRTVPCSLGEATLLGRIVEEFVAFNERWRPKESIGT
jgi:hypothetical protein